MDVVAGFIINKDRVLVARRPLNKSHPGGWEFPGGKVDPGETHEEALQRELEEELGLKVPLSKISTLGKVVGDKIKLNLLKINTDQNLYPKEHMALAWLPFTELGLLDLCPTDRKALQELKTVLLKSFES